jgi:hypothetical protein
MLAALALLLASPPRAASAASSPSLASYTDQNSEAVFLTVLGTASVRISWPAYSATGYSFRLQMKEDDAGFVQLSEISSTRTEYDYSSIRVSSLYVFRVLIHDSRTGTDSLYYNEIVYKPPGTPILPQELAFAQPSPSQIRLSWGYPDSAGFETAIERRMGADPAWIAVATVRAGVNSYVDSGLGPNTQYTYRLRAKYGRAVFSEYVSKIAYSTIAVPQITQFYSVSPSSVYIAWTPTDDASRYQLERKGRGETEFANVATTSYNMTYYTDSSIMPGERYAYRVKALGEGGAQSIYSDEVELTAVYIDISYAITALAVSEYQVDLRWSDLGDRESTYEIWRMDQQYREWKLIATLDRNATQYSDQMVGPGETYAYRVRARSAESDSHSRDSAEATVATKFMLPPDRLAQSRFSDAAISLSWRDNSSGENAFFIERRLGLSGQWSQVTIAEANAVKRDNLPAPAGTPCFYRVGAYSTEYRSVAYSAPIQADNGYAPFIRGSSYANDSALAPEGADDGSQGGGAMEQINLSPEVASAMRRYRIAEVEGGVIVGGAESATRGEFTAMLIRALKPDAVAVGSFDDVKKGHPFYEEIMKAAKIGFARAESGNSFFPDRAITRAEIVAFVYDSLIANRTPLPEHGSTALRPFPDSGDVPAGLAQQARDVFGESIMIGIGMGDGSRILGLDQLATREQAALVAYRFIRWLGRA